MKVFVGIYDYAQKNAVNVQSQKKTLYDAMLQGLVRAGNDVLCIDCTFNKGGIIPQAVERKVKEFNPDICIIGNFGFWDLTEIVDCPIVLFDIDSINHIGMATMYRLRNTLDRYRIILASDADVQTCKDKLGAKDSQVVASPLFIKSDDNMPSKAPSQNIIYFGENKVGDGGKDLINFLASDPTEIEYSHACHVLEEFKKTLQVDSKELYNEINSYANKRLNITNLQDVTNNILGLKKMQYLSYIAELGLTIKGTKWLNKPLYYYPQLIKAAASHLDFSYDYIGVLLRDAKVCLYFNEGPYVRGEYLRVLEILNSSSCLVAQKGGKHDWLLRKAGVPLFETKEELYSICKDLLTNEEKRIAIVKKANKLMIEEFNINAFLEKLNFVVGIDVTGSGGNLQVIEEKNIKLDQTYIASDYTNPKPIVKKEVVSVAPAIPKRKFKDKLKRLLIHFGYDKYNRYSKNCYMLGPIILYEKLNISKTESHIFILSMPVLSIINKDGKKKIGLLFFEKCFGIAKRIYNKVIATPIKKKKQKRNEILLRKKQEKKYVDLQTKLKKGEKIIICLFVSRISCWIFSSLYKLFEESDIFEPVVVVKPFMFNGFEQMVENINITYDTLKNKGYRVLKTYDEETDEFLDLRKELNPDILFYTKYWPPQFHPKYYITNFLDKITFYTSYCYDVAHHPAVMNYEINNIVDRYFMPSNIHKEMASKVMRNKAKNVSVVGAPKLDILFDKTYIPVNVWKKQGIVKKRIIWAPHHSDAFPQNLYQFNAFYELSDFMFNIAKKYSDLIQIAFKPHPMLKPYLYTKWGKESTDAYYGKWANLDNGQLETGEFYDLFLTSDAMILDSISFIAEYTAANKPALFTIGSETRLNLNDFGKLNYEVLYHTKNDLKADIENFVKNVVIDGKDEMKELREEFINKYLLPPNNKTAAENIVDNIIEVITGGKRGNS